MFVRYLRALFGTAWGTALLIAGFISTAMTFVAVYVPEFHLPRWILIAIALAAFLFAPSRLYAQQAQQIAQLELERREFERAREQAALSEVPHVVLAVRWPDENPVNKPLQFLATNRGEFPLRSFQLQTLTLGWSQVSFANVTTLDPAVAQQIEYKIPGTLGDQDVDLLDVLMVNRSSEISPMEYPLRAQVTKANGEIRHLRYKLIYAPLNNPRKVGTAPDAHLCILIEAS